MSELRTLGGKVVLVTGAGQRVGRAIAEGVAKLGADLAVHFNSSREGAEDVARRIRIDGNRAELFAADLTKAEQITALVEAVEKTLGPIAALVSSAGIYERHDFLETPLEALDRQWLVNARAPFLLAQEVGRRMKARGTGDIVNVLDIGGALNVWRHYAAYTMTKAALASLTKTLAVELAPEIRVNGVAPGTILPPESLSAETRAELKDRIPQKRFGDPSDVVEVVKFLLQGPRFVTGQIIAVDGGRSLAGG